MNNVKLSSPSLAHLLHPFLKLTSSAFVCALLACNSEKAAAQPSNPQEAAAAAYATYQQYCVSCHGPEMNGGNGGSLVDDVWKHGSTREDHYKTISEGLPDLGMPAYGKTLTPLQINALVDLIQKKTVPDSSLLPKREITGEVINSMDYQIHVETWLVGIDQPWGLTFADENTAILTEKKGGVRVISNLLTAPTLGPKIANTPEVDPEGQGGMLGIAVHPDYKTNGWVYLGYSHQLPENKSLAMTRVVRGKINNGSWTEQETIWQANADAYTSTRHHYGVRLVFGPDGMLYFGVGERGDQTRAQLLKYPVGKIHRITPEGKIPADNPFVGKPGVVESIWSFGQRNPQGLAFNPVTGDLWESEHGPKGGDELNIIRPGRNYGWPEITYGINYNGSVITKERVRPGLEQPIWFWRPSIAVCAIDFYEGGEFPFWQNHLIATSLGNQSMRLLQIQNERVIHEELILKDKGRIRDCVSGPDGAIYLVMNDPDKILRLTSIEEKIR